jgi:hypothetical protein
MQYERLDACRYNMASIPPPSYPIFVHYLRTSTVRYASIMLLFGGYKRR